jgi:gliding-associated putative ABC transporter substrate-binding component GldG
MKNDRDKLIIVLSTIGSLICLNVLAVQNFWRADLTHDGVFTLSEASLTTMKDLEDPVTVTAYFTSNLPPPFSQNAQFVQDILEEYRAASRGKLAFEFIDPEAAETEEDKEIKKEIKRDVFGRAMREKTSIETELETLGVQPVEIRVIEQDQAQTKRAYMGLVVRYGEETETIPVVQNTGNLEYILTTAVRNLTRTRVPVLGVVSGHGELTLTENLTRLQMLLDQVYEVRELALKDSIKDGKIDGDYDALLIIGPQTAFSEGELKAIDAFVQEGKSAAFLVDAVRVDLKTLSIEQTDHGLADLLASYGVELGGQLVADATCAQLSVQRRMGPMMVNMPLPYPFIPQLKTLEPESSITRNLADVSLPFATPVYLSDEAKKEGGKVKGQILARSTEQSWLEDATQQNLNPQRFTQNVSASFTGPYDLMATLEGELQSPYGNAPAKPAEGAGDDKAQGSRVLVVGSAGIASDDFLQQTNAALMLNVVDWMLLDPALLSMRTRGLIDPPIDPELSDGMRNGVKIGNVVGVPLLLVFYGLVRWRTRLSRRRRLNQQPGA